MRPVVRALARADSGDAARTPVRIAVRTGPRALRPALARAFGLAAALTLAGCAATADRTGPGEATGVGGVPGAPDIATADARRAAFDDFRVGGSLGYWDEAQNVTARIDWREAPGRTELLLAGPLGLGALSVTESAAGATLARRGAAPVTGPSAGALLQGELGLAAPIPLDAARDWLRGLPGEGATDVRRDASGRLETVLWPDASGARWFARVRRWTEVDGFELPALLTARSGERHLRLALNDWRPGGGDGTAGGRVTAGAAGADGADGAVDSAESAPPVPGAGRLAIPGR